MTGQGRTERLPSRQPARPPCSTGSSGSTDSLVMEMLTVKGFRAQLYAWIPSITSGFTATPRMDDPLHGAGRHHLPQQAEGQLHPVRWPALLEGQPDSAVRGRVIDDNKECRFCQSIVNQVEFLMDSRSNTELYSRRPHPRRLDD